MKRLEEENNALVKRQTTYQRSREHEPGADMKFEQFCSKAMFRIQILEQRLSRHNDTSLIKYKNLAQKLQVDPRLAILHRVQ